MIHSSSLKHLTKDRHDMRILVLLFVFLPSLVIGQKSVGLKFTDQRDNLPLISASLKVVEKSKIRVYLTDTLGKVGFSTSSDSIKIILSHTSMEGELIKDLFLDSIDSGKYYREIKVNTKVFGLDTLLVTKNINPIQYSEGKILFNPSLDPSLKGRATQDVLNRVPLVQVDASGNISLRGNSNVRILLNGTDIADLGLSQKDIVKIIGSSNIERIEVSAISGAESDAESSSGYINILTKSKFGIGMKTELGVHAKLGNSYELSPNANFSYGLSKMNLYLSAGNTLFETNGSTAISNNFIPESSKVNQVGELKYNGNPFYINAGMYLDLGKGNSLRYSGVFNNNSFDYKTVLNALVESHGNKNEYGLSNTNAYQTSNLANSVEYKKEFEEGGILKISGTYSKANSKIEGLSRQENQTDSNYYNNLQNVFIAQADYSVKKTKMNYYTGLKLIERDFEDKVNGNFNNNNRIYSGYFQTLLNLGKFSIITGIRNEYTQVKGSVFESDYNNLLPNAGLYKKINNGQVGIVYAMKIFRPGINVLNPNRLRVTDIVFIEGDPNIKPEKNHAVSFNFQKYFSERFNVYWDIKYSINKDFIARETKLEGEKTVLSYTNLGQIEEWSSSLNSKVNLLKGLDWTLQANVDYADIKASSLSFNKKWHFKLSNELRYTYKGFTAELNYYYYTAKYFYQNKFSSPAISQFTLHKSFGKVDVYLGTINPFAERATYKNEYKTPELMSANIQNIHIRSFTFGLTYSFGNLKVKNKTGDIIRDNTVKEGNTNPIGGN